MSYELKNFLIKLLNSINQIISNPRADPKQTLILGSALVLLIAILALIVLTIYSVISDKYGSKKKKVIKREVVPVRPLTTREKTTFFSIAAAIFVIIIVGVYIYAEQPSVCARCHTEKVPFKTWKKSAHNSIGCLGCHRSPGISGYASQKIGYLRWLWNYGTSQYEKPIKSTVNNGSCTKCHSDVFDKITSKKGIRVKHKEIIKSGSRCTDCHSDTGHEVTFIKLPSMEQCVNCHNNKIASSKCETCHMPTTPGGPDNKDRKIYPFDMPGPKNCRSCHKPTTWKKCISCHGLEMPHPPNWTQKHPRLAFINKQVCFKCHTFPQYNSISPHGGNAKDGFFCNNCHSFPSPHGTSERWIGLHGKLALSGRSSPEKNCNCHGSASIYLCNECHGGTMCNSCHSGKYELISGQEGFKRK